MRVATELQIRGIASATCSLQTPSAAAAFGVFHSHADRQGQIPSVSPSLMEWTTESRDSRTRRMTPVE